MPLRILVLGGTSFLGRHLAEQAVEAGHAVTVFHRGKTGLGVVGGAQERLGDRDGGLEALEGGRWDVAIDTSGYVPRVVAQSVRLLLDRVEHYTFVSTISVYADFSAQGLREDAGVLPLPEPASEDVGPYYGALKAACERVVLDALGPRALVVRPGLIVGPYDPTDRFTYWPLRLGRPGPVLVPGRPDRQVQIIDARDLGAWMLDMAARRASGVYNATGPDRPLTMAEMVGACARGVGRRPRLVWVDDAFLEVRKVGAWMELPLWLPDSMGMAGMLGADISRAVRMGLRFRPIEETARDTAAWAERDGRWRRKKAGMAPRRERELLAAWRQVGAPSPP